MIQHHNPEMPRKIGKSLGRFGIHSERYRNLVIGKPTDDCHSQPGDEDTDTDTHFLILLLSYYLSIK